MRRNYVFGWMISFGGAACHLPMWTARGWVPHATKTPQTNKRQKDTQDSFYIYFHCTIISIYTVSTSCLNCCWWQQNKSGHPCESRFLIKLYKSGLPWENTAAPPILYSIPKARDGVVVVVVVATDGRTPPPPPPPLDLLPPAPYGKPFDFWCKFRKYKKVQARVHMDGADGRGNKHGHSMI